MPKRSAVTSHASSALLAIESFVIAGKPAQISAAREPNAAPASGEGAAESLIGEPLVNTALEPLQRLDRGGVVERQVLHHEHAADPASRVDPELRVEDPGPAHAARRARGRVRMRARDLETEAELVAARAERKRLGEGGNGSRLLLHENRADVVLAHQCDRRLAQEAHAVRSAAVVQE